MEYENKKNKRRKKMESPFTWTKIYSRNRPKSPVLYAKSKMFKKNQKHKI